MVPCQPERSLLDFKRECLPKPAAGGRRCLASDRMFVFLQHCTCKVSYWWAFAYAGGGGLLGVCSVPAQEIHFCDARHEGHAPI